MSRLIDGLTKKEIAHLVNFAAVTARKAGEVLKEGFTRSKSISYKGRINPVTEYDLTSEKLIVGAITKKFPDHDILSEEGAERESQADLRWIIDPLDGTVNYAHGYPVYSVAIAVQFRNVTVAGVVYDPEREELFSAGFKQGAFLNGERIKVSTESSLQRAMLATGFSYGVATAKRNNIGYFGRAVKKAQAIRRGGSAALDLSYLAAGRFDGFWELDLAPWDMAAALLIVTEAGGKSSRIRDNRQADIFGNELMATNGKIHNQLRHALFGR